MNKHYEYFLAFRRLISIKLDWVSLVRMCIAHYLNGGEVKGLYEMALDYLMSLEEQ